jgi:hypothetical protein
MLGAAILIAGAVTPARAQVFAERKAALVDYSKADMEPRKACETLTGFKSKEIVQIKAATAQACSWCRGWRIAEAASARTATTQ